MTHSDDANGAAQAALEYIKQIITLASGILALSGTFIEKLVKDISYPPILLLASWLLLLVSVYYGLATISTIVKSKLKNDQEWATGYGKRCATICKLTFIGGIAVFLIFVSWSLMLQAGKPSDEHKRKRCIDREHHIAAAVIVAASKGSELSIYTLNRSMRVSSFGDGNFGRKIEILFGPEQTVPPCGAKLGCV